MVRELVKFVVHDFVNSGKNKIGERFGTYFISKPTELFKFTIFSNKPHFV